MMMRIEYPDGKACEVEADTVEVLYDLMNEALGVLWGNSARPVGKVTYNGSKMTTDEADEFMNWKNKR